jgi:aspartate kinase
MSLVIDNEYLKKGELELVLEEIRDAVHPDKLYVHENVALIAAVGHGMVRNVGVSARLFAAIANAGINVIMIDQGSSELNIIVGVENKDCDDCIRAIYKEFFN